MPEDFAEKVMPRDEELSNSCARTRSLDGNCRDESRQESRTCRVAFAVPYSLCRVRPHRSERVR